MAKVNIINKRVRFDYEIIDEYTCGVELKGFEAKSIRVNGANIKDSFCFFIDGELFCDFNIPEGKTIANTKHDPKRKKKLLLTKKEIKKIIKQKDIKGNTIIPYVLFTNEKNLLKMKIVVGKGKKKFEKREAIKEKDFKRELKY